MKRLIILFLIVFCVNVFADIYNINAVYNESIAKHYVINDTNLIEFKSDLKDTHIVSVGYYSEAIGYLDFTNLEVIKNGYDNYNISFQVMKFLSNNINRNRYKTDSDNYYNEFYSDYFNFKCVFHKKYSTKSEAYYIEVK